ncbi:hypothetical protein [Streptomyces sp. NPDC058145]|uniref:hypothetical protein n=1 Tax=Streptomyces sp. NPDC058145 TaxID=3346356 RepID=UPI0036E0CA3E
MLGGQPIRAAAASASTSADGSRTPPTFPATVLVQQRAADQARRTGADERARTESAPALLLMVVVVVSVRRLRRRTTRSPLGAAGAAGRPARAAVETAVTVAAADHLRTGV